MTVAEIKREMGISLKGLVPDVEFGIKAELIAEILDWKKKRNAVILGHNYMEPSLYHFIPDFRGDSLELSRQAAKTDKPVIVFCGVRFMAETAKILNPDKLVLLPSMKAGCSLAESITAGDVRGLKARFPGVPVVTYVNTYADVKAESDLCCTSGNAEKVIRSFGDRAIIFLPDQYLASNLAVVTGRPILFPENIPEGEMPPAGSIVGWKGRCEVHERYTVEDIKAVRAQFPDVAVLSHPECSPTVVAASDFSGSTKEMIDFVETTKKPRYLMLTECSMGDNVQAAHPEKEMLRLCMVRCPHMNKITLEDTLRSLKEDREAIEVPEDIAKRARRAVERMISIG
jgi:quinolinate synthase